MAPGLPAALQPHQVGLRSVLWPHVGRGGYFTHASDNSTHDLHTDEEEKHEDGYLIDLISHKAVDFVERMAQGTAQVTPFFLSLHYTAPYWPWETREDHALAAAVKDNLFHMNEGIGCVVDALKKTGLLDNTLIVFTSDNGGERFSDNRPQVGGTMDLTEGGIRVPWIAHWPAEIAPGGTSAQHCMTMDWSTTMVELAGTKAHEELPFDGVSLAPRSARCQSPV